MNISFNAVISLIGIASFGLLIVPTALRWRTKERATLTLSLYLALGLVWSMGVAVTSLNILTNDSQNMLFMWLAILSQAAMPLVFGALTLAFLSQTRSLYWYWGAGIIVYALWVVLQLDSYGLTNLALPYLPPNLPTERLIQVWKIAIWSLATVVALVALFNGFRKHRQAQYRNRFRYWLGGTIILSAAYIIFFWPNPNIYWIGAALNIVGSLLITYIVLRYHPPELKIVVTRIVQSVTVTLILSVILFGALNSAYLITNWTTNTRIILIALITLSLVLGYLLPRLADWIGKRLSTVLFGSSFDETSAIQAYSQNVSTDYDFGQLSSQALEFILQEMKVKRGALFIDEGDGSGHVTLKLVTSVQMPEVETGYFIGSDPWIAHLRQQKTAITQYDLDVLPQFRDMDETGKEWLAQLDADLFYPIILRQRELIGVLALGPKPNHRPYLPADLERLKIHASQIAVDLDKAKLFVQLSDVNQQLGNLSSEFETVNQGKTDFLSIASHELRTPLTHIHGYASMLLEATESDLQDPAYLAHVFNGIAKGSTRLKSVVDLIFDVSRAEIGELEIAHDPISPAEIIRQATENQAEALELRKHKLIISGINDLPLIQGDMTHLSQAMTQLLNNAIKYTPDGGTITITGRELKEQGQPDRIELIITDTGIGINPKDHKRIFDKFYRVGDVQNHSTGSVKFKGAGPGLGLPLTAGIAKAHGGSVWVESPEYNEETCPGSQFHLVLPVHSPLIEKPALVKQTSPTAETRHWRSKDMQKIKERLAKQQRSESPDKKEGS